MFDYVVFKVVVLKVDRLQFCLVTLQSPLKAGYATRITS